MAGTGLHCVQLLRDPGRGCWPLPRAVLAIAPLLCLSAENGPKQGWRGDNRGVPGVLPEGKATSISALGLGHPPVPWGSLSPHHHLGREGGMAGLPRARLGLCFGNCIYAGIPVQIGRAMHPSRAWKLPVILGALVPQLRAAMIVKRGLGGAAQIAVLYPTPPLPTSSLQDENIMRSMQLFDNVI